MSTCPAYIGNAYVVRFAEADASVQFVQRGDIFVGGELLGRVARLAICQEFQSEDEYLVLFCNEAWESCGVIGGYKSIEEAKARVERSYQGLSGKWHFSPVSKEEALVRFESELAQESCSFCGRTPYGVRAMVGESVRICDVCVREFYEALYSDESQT